MKDILTTRAFLMQFDKGNKTAQLPNGFELQCRISYEKEFKLIDEKANKVACENGGVSTYKNKTDDGIVIIGYEKLIQALGNRISKCCDFVVYSENKKSFIICNELSVSNKKIKWPDARFQFSATVRHLLKCEETKAIIEGIKNKYCVLSTKIEHIVSPDNMAKAFDNPYNLFKQAEQLHWTVVEKMGFTIWESNIITYENEDSVQLAVR